MRHVIVSNGCDSVLPEEPKVPFDWLDIRAPTASAAGGENPPAVVEATPPVHSPLLPTFSPTVRCLSPAVEDVLMTLCDVQTQIIEYSSGVVPATARFRNEFITDAYLTEDDEEEEDDDDLKSATSMDNGGGTPIRLRLLTSLQPQLYRRCLRLSLCNRRSSSQLS